MFACDSTEPLRCQRSESETMALAFKQAKVRHLTVHVHDYTVTLRNQDVCLFNRLTVFLCCCDTVRVNVLPLLGSYWLTVLLPVLIGGQRAAQSSALKSVFQAT